MKIALTILFALIIHLTVHAQLGWGGSPDSIVNTMLKHRIASVEVRRPFSGDTTFSTCVTIRNDTNQRVITVSEPDKVHSMIWYNSNGKVDSSKSFATTYDRPDSVFVIFHSVNRYDRNGLLIRQTITRGGQSPGPVLVHTYFYNSKNQLRKERFKSHSYAGYWCISNLRGYRMVLHKVKKVDTGKSTWEHRYSSYDLRSVYKRKVGGQTLLIKTTAKYPNGKFHRFAHEWRTDSANRERSYYNLMPNDTFLGETIKYDSLWQISESTTPHPSLGDYKYYYASNGVLSSVSMQLFDTVTQYLCNRNGDIIMVNGVENYRYTYY